MISCVDNVFEKPNEILKFADTLEYNDVGNTRGVRSKHLNEINQELFNFINTKILNCFYPGSSYKFFAKSFFQKNEYDINDGWVHSDNGLITAVVYLTKGGTAGTSIYEQKDEHQLIKPQDKKHNYFNNHKNYSITKKQEIQELKLKNNSLFNKTASFTGRFNRLIAFNSKIWHAAELQKPNENRMTLISFIEKIKKHDD